MENRKPGRIIYIFLPVIVMSLIQTGVSFFLSQVYVGIVAKTKGPLTITQMVQELLELSSGEEYFLVYSIVSEIFCLLVFFVWYRYVLKEDAGNVVELDFVKPSYATIILGCILCAVGGQFVLTFVAELIIKIKPDWLISYEGALENIGLSAKGASVLSIAVCLYVVVLAPLMEELLFRGLCIKYSSRCFGQIGTLLISSVFFAVAHGNPLQSVVTFVFALILGCISIKTDTVWIAIVIHVLFNGLSYFAPDFIALTQKPVSDFLILFTSLVAVYLGVGCILRGKAK